MIFAIDTPNYVFSLPFNLSMLFR